MYTSTLQGNPGCLVAPQLPYIWHHLQGPGMHIFYSHLPLLLGQGKNTPIVSLLISSMDDRRSVYLEANRLIPESTSRYMSFCKRYFAKVWTSSVQSRHFQPDLLVAMEEKAAAWNCEVQPISWQRSPDNRRHFPSLGPLSFSKIHSYHDSLCSLAKAIAWYYMAKNCAVSGVGCLTKLTIT